MANTNTKRKPLFGNKRSHALNSSRRKQKLNIVSVLTDKGIVKMTAREAKKFKKDTKTVEEK